MNALSDEVVCGVVDEAVELTLDDEPVTSGLEDISVCLSSELATGN